MRLRRACQEPDGHLPRIWGAVVSVTKTELQTNVPGVQNAALPPPTLLLRNSDCTGQKHEENESIVKYLSLFYLVAPVTLLHRKI